ncbi:hypothetical protein KDK88_07790 [bacterium]|nr:hypothetical protein [bacterium]
MTTLRTLTLVLLLAALPAAALDRDAADKTIIDDGSMVLDAGNLLLNVTNLGLLGATPGVTTAPWHGAPSARWPGAGGVDHLYAAGLWVGARVLGSVHVTTGQFEREMQATDDPLDVIYAGDPWFVGGARYPDEPADADQDGLEDEDPLNGLDDDGDGNVDEDYAMIADQYFRCVMRDDLAAVQEAYPDHVPLGLEIVQETFQWRDAAIAGAVGLRYTVRNVGEQVLEDVHLGLFADPDVGASDVPGEAEDDLPFTWSGVVSAGGAPVQVDLVGMRDAGAPVVGGRIAAVPLGLSKMGVELDAAPVAMAFMSGRVPFDFGGDPTNDAERYEMLSTPRVDADPTPGHENDYRICASSQAVATLAPGESLVYDAALIVAGSLDELVDLAGAMAVVRRGAAYDRDGDSGNGAEFVVRWLHNDDVVGNEDEDDELPDLQAAALSAAPNPFNPRTVLAWSQALPGRVRLTVHDLGGRAVARLVDGPRAAGEHRVTWNGAGDDGRALPSGRYLAVLETADGRSVRALALLR